MVTALRETKGTVYLAADRLGCHFDTIYERAKTSSTVADAMRSERGKFVDLAETKLYDAVVNGEPWAVRMTLMTLGKDRGYYEKTEVESNTKNRLIIEEESAGDRGSGPQDSPAAPGANGVPAV